MSLRTGTSAQSSSAKCLGQRRRREHAAEGSRRVGAAPAPSRCPTRAHACRTCTPVPLRAQRLLLSACSRLPTPITLRVRRLLLSVPTPAFVPLLVLTPTPGNHPAPLRGPIPVISTCSYLLFPTRSHLLRSLRSHTLLSVLTPTAVPLFMLARITLACSPLPFSVPSCLPLSTRSPLSLCLCSHTLLCVCTHTCSLMGRSC